MNKRIVYRKHQNNTDGVAVRQTAHKNIRETLENSRATFEVASEDSSANGQRAKLSGDFGPAASRVSFLGCHKKAGFLGEVGARQETNS